MSNETYIEQYTWSEIKAHLLLCGSGGGAEPTNFHKAANEIIALAEQIKAERAIVAMKKKSNE